MFSVNGKTLLEDDLHILSMLQSEIYNRTGITFLGWYCTLFYLWSDYITREYG